MTKTHSGFTRIVAILCSAQVACGNPTLGTRTAALDDPKEPPPITPLPDGPIHVPDGSIVPSQEAGTLPGALSVSSAGKAQYTIPLRVPQGRAGIQPRLSLHFGDGNNNGLLGVGWGLTGLSRVAPCARTVAQDGAPDRVHFRAGDEYCLDGTRLVALAGGAPGDDGTVYRLERDDQIKVVSEGTYTGVEFAVPARFVAYHPDGSTWIYGRRLEATQVEHTSLTGDDAPATRKVVWSWALEMVKDRIGNTMTFEYEVIAPTAPSGAFAFDGGQALEFYPKRIHYTAHEGLEARRTIDFEYKPRPDPIDLFVSGVHLHTSQRLARIVASAPNPSVTKPVWSYELRYITSKSSGRSLLAGITLCDDIPTCLPETELAWRDSDDGYARIETPIAVLDGAKMTQMRPADFNGDGLTDLLFWEGQRQWCECSASCLELQWSGTGDSCGELGTFRVSGEWKIAYSDGTTLGSVAPTGLVAEFQTRTDFIAETPVGAGPEEYNAPIVLDFDGDGAADLLSARTGEIRSPSRGNLLLQDIGSTYEALPPFWEADVRYLGDFNGDGRIDLFTNANRPVPTTTVTPEGTAVTDWSEPSEWDEYQWAFRLGGGAPVLLASQPAPIQPYMQRYRRTPWTIWPTVDATHHSLTLDADGDGRTELALPAPDNRFRTFEVGPDGSPVLGELNLSCLWESIDGVQLVTEHVPVYLDINGDGLRDVIASGGVNIGTGQNELLARINTGQGFGPWYVATASGYQIPVTPWSGQDNYSPAPHDNGVRVLDHNADGRDDFVVPTASGPMLYLSNGRGFAAEPAGFELEPAAGMAPPGSSDLYLGYTHQFGDVNGDGMPDLIELDMASRKVVIWQRSRPPQALPDRLLAVRNGLGRWDSVVRRPLSDRTVYQPGAGCSFPQTCLRGGGEVVSLLQRTEPGGSSEYREYTYRDGRADRNGRGFLGFAWRYERVTETDQVTSIEYDISRREHGAYPLAGVPVFTRTETPIDATRTRVVIEKAAHEVRWTAFDQVYMVRASEGVQEVHEVAGPVPPYLATEEAGRIEKVTRSWDEYGNLDSQDSRRYGRVVPEGGGSSVLQTGTRTFVDYKIENREAEWLLGIPTGTVVTSYTAPSGSRSETRTTRIEPDEHGRPLKVTIEPDDPRLFHQTTYHYGDYGELERIDRENSLVDPELAHEVRTDRIAYDSERLYPTSRCNALGQCSFMAIHPAYGVVVMADDPNGLRSVMTYDGFGRPRGVQIEGGIQEWTDYDHPAGGWYLERIRGGDGAERTEEYDAAGALIRVADKAFDGSFARREITYDFIGRIKTVSNAYIDPADRRWTEVKYDGLGRLIETARPDGSTTASEYHLDETRSWDGRGNESFVRFDVNDRVTDSVNLYREEGAALRTRYAYGPFDQVEMITDPLGHQKTMSYDRLGRQIELRDPDAGRRTSTYSGFGELIEETDPESRTAGVPTTMYRDLLGRIVQIESVDGTDKYIWDAPPVGSSARVWIGARHAAVSSDGIETRIEYDAYGRPARERTQVNGSWLDTDYGYDALSRLARISYPETTGDRFFVDLTYGLNGALALITAPDPTSKTKRIWEATERGPDGRTTRAWFGDKLEAYRTYEPETGRLARMRARVAGTYLDAFRFNYKYDGNGNLTNRDEITVGFGEGFEYDSLDRLDLWSRGPAGKGGYSTEYEYDHGGNLRRRLQRYPVTSKNFDEVFRRDHLADRQNQLTGHEVWRAGILDEDTPMTYDDNGRRTSGPWDQVEYKRFDLPRRVVDGGAATAFRYDGDERRVMEEGPNGKVYRAGRLYERREGEDGVQHVFLIPSDAGVVAQVVQKDGDETRKILYVHDDTLGTGVVITDEDGAVAGRQWFTPFGKRAEGEGRPLIGDAGALSGFTGHRHDDKLGLIDMNGRVYDPVGSGFLTPDPIIAAPLFGQGLNRYSYVYNNPLKYTDPTGFYATPWEYYPAKGDIPAMVGRTHHDDVTGAALSHEFRLVEDTATASQEASDGGGVDDTDTPPAPDQAERAASASDWVEIPIDLRRSIAPIHRAPFEEPIEVGMRETVDDIFNSPYLNDNPRGLPRGPSHAIDIGPPGGPPPTEDGRVLRGIGGAIGYLVGAARDADYDGALTDARLGSAIEGVVMSRGLRGGGTQYRGVQGEFGVNYSANRVSPDSQITINRASVQRTGRLGQVRSARPARATPLRERMSPAQRQRFSRMGWRAPKWRESRTGVGGWLRQVFGL